jgi:hypothetical protein
MQEDKKNIFLEKIKNMTLDRITKESNTDRFELFDLDEKNLSNPVKLHYFSYIMMHSDAVFIEINVYYTTFELKNFILRIFNIQEKDLKDELIHDWTKEFCNLIAGGIKSLLQKSEAKIGISIPVRLRSFDKLWENKKNEDFWGIKWSDGQIYVSTYVEITTDSIWETLAHEEQRESHHHNLELL